MGESFVCFRCSLPGRSYIQGNDSIDVIIIALYAVKEAVEKVNGGDLAALNGACQLSGGLEMNRADLMGRFYGVLPAVKERANENVYCY
jgi:hypothetical protein